MADPDDQMARVRALLAEPEPSPAPVLDAARMRQISARGGVHQWRPVIATVLNVLRDVSARRAGPDPAGYNPPPWISEGGPRFAWWAPSTST